MTRLLRLDFSFNIVSSEATSDFGGQTPSCLQGQ